MRVAESCAECLYNKQKQVSGDKKYLEEIKSIIDNRGEDDTSPYLVYRFSQIYEKFYGQRSPYGEIKKKYNDLVLSMEERIRTRIEDSEDPLVKSFLYARAGNYIDFGAMDSVDDETLLSLLECVELNEKEAAVIQSFTEQCKSAHRFLLITDNCGEIVLDKLFLEQIHKRFPKLMIDVLVRGGEVLNDATKEDAEYVGINSVARVISNGLPIAGTVYDMLPEPAKEALDQSDVILAKGQGNYESLSKQGRHIFYSFLCKCELFTDRFQVPKLTGIFVEE